jgi:hypothetical protein
MVCSSRYESNCHRYIPAQQPRFIGQPPNSSTTGCRSPVGGPRQPDPANTARCLRDSSSTPTSPCLAEALPRPGVDSQKPTPGARVLVDARSAVGAVALSERDLAQRERSPNSVHSSLAAGRISSNGCIVRRRSLKCRCAAMTSSGSTAAHGNSGPGASSTSCAPCIERVVRIRPEGQ